MISQRPSFPKFSFILKSQSLIFKTIVLPQSILVFSPIIWRMLAFSETKINGFGAQGHVPKSRNHTNEGLEGSHISKPKSYKFKLKQNNHTELLSISFP